MNQKRLHRLSWIESIAHPSQDWWHRDFLLQKPLTNPYTTSPYQPTTVASRCITTSPHWGLLLITQHASQEVHSSGPSTECPRPPISVHVILEGTGFGILLFTIFSVLSWNFCFSSPVTVMSPHSDYTQRKRVAACCASHFFFSVQSAAKKHKSATRSKQQCTCAACSRYVGTSRLGATTGWQKQAQLPNFVVFGP